MRLLQHCDVDYPPDPAGRVPCDNQGGGRDRFRVQLGCGPPSAAQTVTKTHETVLL